MAELKIDGLGISILYRGGRYARAVTRGDGVRGDDVTANVKTIKSLPLVIAETRDVEVRGEIYLPSETFLKINREREEREEPLFANPRNAAAGSIRLLDAREVASRKLDVFLYTFSSTGRSRATQWESLTRLKELGFKTNPHSRLCATIDDVLAYYRRMDGEARHSRLRSRRDRGQDRFRGPAAGPRDDGQVPALGDLLQVPGPPGHHPDQRHHHPGRPDRAP